MGVWVGRLGGREAQSAMMRWDSLLHLRGPGCEGHPVQPPPPTVAISKPQSLFLPETPTALAHTSPAPQGPRLGGWRLRVWPLLDLVKAGGAAQGWEGWVQAAGLSGAFGSCVAGVLTPVTPETPPPPQKSQGAEKSPYSLLLAPNSARSNSAGKESIVRPAAPAYTVLLWRAGG